MKKFRRAKGTRDFLPEEMTKRNKIKGIVAKTFESYGYQEIATPIFEEFELFAVRSGEEIREKMFTFLSEDNEYALRPEITASVCRIISEDVLQIPKPYKLYYICPCFRYEQPQAGRYREYWQAGIECIGSSSIIADAEVITVAIRTLENVGLKNFKLKIGNIGILRNLLNEKRVEEELQNKIISEIDKLMSIREKCEAIKLKQKIENNDINFIRAKFEDLYNLQQEIDYGGELEVPLVAEFNNEFVKKWLDKLPKYIDDTTKYIWINEDGLGKELVDFILKITYLKGNKGEIVKKGGRLLKDTKAKRPLDELLELCNLLEIFGIEDYEIVLGVARGLDYYTDMVFEIDCSVLGAEKQICGGGRYDNLVSEFGGAPTPAVGFGIGFDRVVEALEKTREIEIDRKLDIFVATINNEMKKMAIEIAEKLRKRGSRVEIDLLDLPLREQLGYASSVGAKKVIIVAPKELEKNEIIIRDMESMKQNKIKIFKLFE